MTLEQEATGGAAGTPAADTRWAARHPFAVDGALAAAAAALLAPASVQVVASATLGLRWKLLAYAAVAALQLAVVTRRRWPRISYAVGCASMLGLTVLPYLVDARGQTVPGPFLPTALVFFVLLYSVAEQLSARVAVAALVLALVGGAVVLLRLATGELWWSGVAARNEASPWLLLTALILAGSVGAYSLGRLRRTRQAYLHELQERARRTEADRVREAAEAAEDERRRIAREMHDVVSHSLAVIISQAEGGRMTSADPTATTVLSTVADTGRAAMADMRAMLGVLRAPAEATVDDRAPQPGLAQLPQLVDSVRSAGCSVTVTETGTRAALPVSTELAVYRVTQESLTNVVKHAGPRASARVALQWAAERLTLEVTDDGRPRDLVDPRAVASGTGLVGMTERVAAVGGTLRAGPVADPGRPGWRVTATVPLVTGRARS